jgi:hypothetical protein
LLPRFLNGNDKKEKMRLAKGFLLSMTGLFIVITLFSLLIPSKVFTSKAVVINASQRRIVSALSDFQQWKKWHPVLANDSANILISIPSNGLNASVTWGPAAKKNRMTITEVFAQGIKLVLSRSGENPVENAIVLLPLKDSGSYQVEWTAVTRLKWYPWEKFAGIFVSEITGPGYEAALQSLKIFAESPAP